MSAVSRAGFSRAQRAYGAEDPRERFLPLAVEQADRVHGRLPPGALERDEVISLAVIGLIEGLERFDQGRGVPIEAYLRQVIRHRILDGLRSEDRVPKRLRARERLVREAYRDLEQQLMRPATDAEVAARLGIPEREFLGWLSDLAFTTVGSLDALEEDGSPPVGAPAPGPEEEAARRDVARRLAQAVARLPERERQVLWAHYYREYSLHEVALALDLSDSYVSQLHSRAILRLRGQLRGARQAYVGGEGV